MQYPACRHEPMQGRPLLYKRGEGSVIFLLEEAAICKNWRKKLKLRIRLFNKCQKPKRTFTNDWNTAHVRQTRWTRMQEVSRGGGRVGGVDSWQRTTVNQCSPLVLTTSPRALVWSWLWRREGSWRWALACRFDGGTRDCLPLLSAVMN